MWVWSGGFESGTTEWGRLEDRNIYDRESGSLRFSVDADGTLIAPFMLLLTNCESMLESVPSADLRAWDCNAQLERGDEPPRTVRALLRTTDSFTDEGFALGSVTWWEDGQLVRLDWQTHTPLFLPGRCRFAWREGVTEPVPPWPAEPTEGSGEGSGTPIEGSGTPIEGSGEPTPD